MTTKTVKLIALEPIEHDGQPYDLGDTLEVSEKQAEQLIESKAAAAPRDPAAKEAKKA